MCLRLEAAAIVCIFNYGDIHLLYHVGSSACHMVVTFCWQMCLFFVQPTPLQGIFRQQCLALTSVWVF